jgi:hypothetical protein
MVEISKRRDPSAGHCVAGTVNEIKEIRVGIEPQPGTDDQLDPKGSGPSCQRPQNADGYSLSRRGFNMK